MNKNPEIREIDPMFALQNASDELFNKRAQLAAGFLAKQIIVRHPTVNRPADDPTLITNYFYEANQTDSSLAIDKFLDKVHNRRKLTKDLDVYTDKYDLRDHKDIVIISPHTVMADVLGLAALSSLGQLGEGRSSKDNYFFLSRLIGYIDYKIPFKKDAPVHNIFNEAILPMGNIIQVFPKTNTTAQLHEYYPDQVTACNKRALIKMKHHQKQNPNNQHIIFVAPTGSKLKSKHAVSGKYLQMEPVSSATMDMLFSFHKSGIPIIPAGLDFNVSRVYLPYFPPQKFKLHLEKPIINHSNDDLTDPYYRLMFDREVLNSLLRCATMVSRLPVMPSS